jgi:hypothetical protein
MGETVRPLDIEAVAEIFRNDQFPPIDGTQP